MGKEFVWRLVILGSLLIIPIPQMQAIQLGGVHDEYGAAVPDQAQLTQLDPMFFAIIANNAHKEETDNLISFEKTSLEEIRIRLFGHFYVGNEELRDHVYFTLYHADGSVMAEFQHDEFEITRDLFIPANEALGVYTILIDLGIPPNDPLECCAAYNYYLSYSGLDNPPHVQSLGDDFGFYPSWGYTSVINEGGTYNFSFFGTPGDYVLYHQPWGPHEVVTGVTLYDRNDTEISVHIDTVQSKIRWFFTLDQVGYFDFIIDFNDDPLHVGRIIGFKLATSGPYAEDAATIINLYGAQISDADSDLDGIPDSEEYGSGTRPHMADTDGDTFGDLLEIDLGTDPNFDTNKPIRFSGEVVMEEDKHTFSVKISSDITSMPYTNIRYTFELNPNFVVIDESTISGEIPDWNFDGMTFTIETENNGEVPTWFAFYMRLHFEKIVDGDVWGVSHYSVRIPPDRIYSTEPTSSFDPSAPPSLPVSLPLPTLMVMAALIVVPIIRRKYLNQFT